MSLPPFPSASTAASYARDLAERVVSTFLQAFLGAIVVSAPFSLSMWQNAAVAGVAAGFALVKGVIARVRGNAGSASLVKGV
jgi:hypothetical protein